MNAAKIIGGILIGLIPIAFICSLFGLGVTFAMMMHGEALHWWNYLFLTIASLGIVAVAGFIGSAILSGEV